MSPGLRDRWGWVALGLSLIAGAGGAVLVDEARRSTADSMVTAAPAVRAPSRVLLPAALAPALVEDPAPPRSAPEVPIEPVEGEVVVEPSATAAAWITTATGLQYLDAELGSGAVPRVGQRAVVHYDAWIDDHGANGRLLDSSRGRAQPLEFALGGGQVIPGWDEALSTMRVGGRRTVEVPAALVHGDRVINDRIPPGATLRFEIELLDVTDP